MLVRVLSSPSVSPTLGFPSALACTFRNVEVCGPKLRDGEGGSFHASFLSDAVCFISHPMRGCSFDLDISRHVIYYRTCCIFDSTLLATAALFF